MYRNNPKYCDRQVQANNVGLDQMSLQTATFDQG